MLLRSVVELTTSFRNLFTCSVLNLIFVGKVLAIPKAISNACLQVSRIEYYEINETFSVSFFLCVAFTCWSIVSLFASNVLGCSGPRILVTLLGVGILFLVALSPTFTNCFDFCTSSASRKWQMNFLIGMIVVFVGSEREEWQVRGCSHIRRWRRAVLPCAWAHVNPLLIIPLVLPQMKELPLFCRYGITGVAHSRLWGLFCCNFSQRRTDYRRRWWWRSDLSQCILAKKIFLDVWVSLHLLYA